MAQPKSSSKSSSPKSTKSKKVAAPATGKVETKKASKRAVSAKSAKVDLSAVAVVPEPVIAAVTADVAPVVEAAPVTTEVVEVVERPTRTVSRAEFTEMVRKEAYRRAALRHFRNGSPFQDWVNAEAAVSGKLAAEGARLS